MLLVAINLPNIKYPKILKNDYNPGTYSSESTQREVSNEYQHDNGFQKSLRPYCASDKSSPSIERVNV